MIWNRTHKPSAQVIPFPVEKVSGKKPVDVPDGGMGKILLFTGVRYERFGDTAQVWRDDDDHRPPRRGGSRS